MAGRPEIIIMEDAQLAKFTMFLYLQLGQKKKKYIFQEVFGYEKFFDANNKYMSATQLYIYIYIYYLWRPEKTSTGRGPAGRVETNIRWKKKEIIIIPNGYRESERRRPGIDRTRFRLEFVIRRILGGEFLFYTFWRLKWKCGRPFLN